VKISVTSTKVEHIRQRTHTFIEDKEPTSRQLQFASGYEILQSTWCTNHDVNLTTPVNDQPINQCKPIINQPTNQPTNQPSLNQ